MDMSVNFSDALTSRHFYTSAPQLSRMPIPWNPESPCSAWMTLNEFGSRNDGIRNAQTMKVLLVVACSLLLFTLLLSIPAVDALQGKRLDSAISNVATPET
jgi:hypothetical protein